MIKQLLENCGGFWTSKGPYSDIIFSSRIRLARNMSDILFVNKIDKTNIESLKSALYSFINKSIFKSNLFMLAIDELSDNEKRYLRERNIITYEMERSPHSFVIINNKENFNILINEEDHFRIQVIRPGLQLMEAYRLADHVDDELNKFIKYSFSNEYGYLTGCPSNLGTGIKASVIIHLPILTRTDEISGIVQKQSEIGIELKGLNSYEINPAGCLYQLSSKISLGISEIDTIELLDCSISKILEEEDDARDKYLSEKKNVLEDLIWRSFGILSYSRHINYKEAMEHLSNLRLGIILAIIKKVDINLINILMVNIQQSHLQCHYSEIFKGNAECNEFRAEYLRNNIHFTE